MLVLLPLTSYISYLSFLLPLRPWAVFLYDFLQQHLLQSLLGPLGGHFLTTCGKEHLCYIQKYPYYKKNRLFLSQPLTPPCPSSSAEYKRAFVI